MSNNNLQQELLLAKYNNLVSMIKTYQEEERILWDNYMASSQSGGGGMSQSALQAIQTKLNDLALQRQEVISQLRRLYHTDTELVGMGMALELQNDNLSKTLKYQLHNNDENLKDMNQDIMTMDREIQMQQYVADRSVSIGGMVTTMFYAAVFAVVPLLLAYFGVLLSKEVAVNIMIAIFAIALARVIYIMLVNRMRSTWEWDNYAFDDPNGGITRGVPKGSGPTGNPASVVSQKFGTGTSS